MEEIAGHPDVDIVVIATSGKAGLSAPWPLSGPEKKLLLQQRTACHGGEIITREAKKSGAQLLPSTANTALSGNA